MEAVAATERRRWERETLQPTLEKSPERTASFSVLNLRFGAQLELREPARVCFVVAMALAAAGAALTLSRMSRRPAAGTGGLDGTAAGPNSPAI